MSGRRRLAIGTKRNFNKRRGDALPVALVGTIVVMIFAVASLVPVINMINSYSPSTVVSGLQPTPTEQVSYEPGYLDTTDLESGTKTIAATSEAAGVGNADYSYNGTVVEVPPNDLTVLSMGSALDVTIASGMTSTQVNCRAYIDAQDADHRLLDVQWASTGTYYERSEFTESSTPAMFSLLTDGGSHTIYVYLWVDSNDSTTTLIRWGAGVGTTELADSQDADCLSIDTGGDVWASAMFDYSYIQSGTSYFRPDEDSLGYITLTSDNRGTFLLESVNSPRGATWLSSGNGLGIITGVVVMVVS